MIRKFYQKIFALVYDSVMASTELSFGQIRSNLLSELEGTILDVGSGTGVNFPFFKKATKVIAIEPSMAMLEKSIPKIPNSKNIAVYNFPICAPEVEEIIEDSSLDAIVCTLVLCTIPDQNLALEKFQRWLKPDGRLVILEHIRSKNHLNGKIQDLINPAWKVIGDGCNLNRDTDEFIKSAGFEMIREDYFKYSTTWYEGVFKKSAP